jgi:pimeloyl-ACP methyl ester carboxylesterase
MVDKKKTGSPLGKLLGTIALVKAGWIAYSAFGINHRMPIGPAIDAPREIFNGRSTGFLTYYVDRAAAGRPLVLLHAINAAGSSYEMRPIFEHYRTLRPVYALDLPGFGFSERTNKTYTRDTYKDAILDLLSERVGEPADVIALSLSSEFAARAALERPDLFHSLTLISPSGFTDREKRSSQSASDVGLSDLVHGYLSFPLWGQAVYDLLATRASIRWFLKKSFNGPVDEGMVAYDYLTTHQPGARHAPLYFVSGKLFTPSIREAAYERLEMPVLVLYDQDYFVRFETLPTTLERCPNWRAERISPTYGLPHFEKMPQVARALDSFWGSL